MKKIVLLALLAAPLFGQAKEIKTSPYPRFAFNVYTLMWGVSGGGGTAPQSELRIDLIRGGRGYFLASFSGGYYFKGSPYDKAVKPWHLGFHVGGGGYLFNKRGPSGRGWTGVMDGTFGMRALFNTFSASTEAKRQAFLEKPSGLGYLLTLGLGSIAVKYPMDIDLSFEINNYYRYYAAQNFGVQIGLHLGFGFSTATVEVNNSLNPWGFDSTDKIHFYMRYALSFGFIF